MWKDDMIVGAFIPTCLDSGEYQPVQCHGSSGYCWCVSEGGEKIEGTEKGPGQGLPECGK